MLRSSIKKFQSYLTITRNNSFGFSQAQNQKVIFFPGDGIGPEIAQSVIDIFSASKVPIDWEFHKIHTQSVTKQGDLISDESIQAVKDTKWGLKGPFETPIGKGHRSLNLTLRKRLQLYANVRPCKSIKGVKTPYEKVDLVTIRENTEGEYSGLEHEVVPGVVENLKIISQVACTNIAEYAFFYAQQNNRKNVVACHKAGIQKLGDGMFIRTCHEISKKYPDIKYSELQIDTICLKLAKDPQDFDLMVMPNLYGDIVSDLAAGLIGGLGLTASGNIGKDCAIYEAVHGSAPDIAGKNLANPTALLLSSVMMIKAMGMRTHGDRIENSILRTIEQGKFITRDLGGKTGTKEFTQAIIGNFE